MCLADIEQRWQTIHTRIAVIESDMQVMDETSDEYKCLEEELADLEDEQCNLTRSWRKGLHQND